MDSPTLSIRSKIQRSSERFWSADDFTDQPRRAVLRTLGRLADQGELVRLRRGVYWSGEQPPQPQQLIEAVIDCPGIGPAGASAALELGVNTLHPERPIFAVPLRAPREIEGLEVVSRAGRRGRIDQRLDPLEVALFELLGDWSVLSALPADELRERLAQMLASDARLRPGQLAKAAATEPAAVREGLRTLMAAAGLDASAVSGALSPFSAAEALR